MRAQRVAFRIAIASFLSALSAVSISPIAAAEPQQPGSLAAGLRQADTQVFPDSKRGELGRMVREDLRRRLEAANRRSSRAWAKVDTVAKWEAFAKPRLAALRDSLGESWRGELPKAPPRVVSAGRISGDGFHIEKLLFESRPGLWVTANLYLPLKWSRKIPAIVIVHSHHAPKTSGELQDMGMTWARAGCAVLVMDQLGHGERREHPFATNDDYAGEFRLSRQDYYFRYDTSLQLYLAGESLMGWMVWDIRRGVDMLLARGDIDPDKLVLLGSVAGGGDPAAVAGALDDRFAVVAPFNFGGPQPETRYPLPEDAEETFNYAGSGSWESTRNLRLSARDGFLPWVIVGGIAPRRLIFAHEFNWDRPRDPVWKRLQTIYKLYEQPDRLAFTHGRGELKQRPPQATHCTHIGRFHRVKIHEALDRWLGIKVRPEDEYSNRLAKEKLLCWTDKLRRQLKPRKLHAILGRMADSRRLRRAVKRSFEAALRRPATAKEPDREAAHREARRAMHDVFRKELAAALGPIEPKQATVVASSRNTLDLPGGAKLEKLALETEPGILVPLTLVRPANVEKPPVVMLVGQAGKKRFLQARSAEIARLVEGGAAVCLPDLRGIGETRAGSDRGRYSADTSRSATELMLGGTMLGARLRDLRTVLGYLRTRGDLDASRLAIWGDSLGPPNPSDAVFKVPRRISNRPRQSEPLGGALALLAALYEQDIKAVYVAGGLTGFRSLLESQHVYAPHDAIVPGLLPVGDLGEIAAALAPRPLRLEALVDHHNRLANDNYVIAGYGAAVASYKKSKSPKALELNRQRSSPSAWLLRHLQGGGP